MKQVFYAIAGLGLSLSLAPGLQTADAAPGSPRGSVSGKPGAAGKPAKPRVRFTTPPQTVARPATAAAQATTQLKSRRTGKSQKIRRPRTSARGGGVGARAQTPGRNATDGRGTRGTPGRAVGFNGVSTVGQQNSRRWSTETNRPTPFNRRNRTTTRRGANGVSKTMKSSKPGPKPPRASRSSITSERLPRLRRNQQGQLVEQGATLPRGAGAQGMAYRALSGMQPAPPTTPQPAPPPNRPSTSVTMMGQKRTFKSAKRLAR